MIENKLTPKKFDALVTSNSKVIWTIPAIAKRIDRRESFVVEHMLDAPDSPIKKVGGRWCAVEDELLNFFRP